MNKDSIKLFLCQILKKKKRNSCFKFVFMLIFLSKYGHEALRLAGDGRHDASE